MAERTLNHFAIFAFTETYWSLSHDRRNQLNRDLLAGLRGASSHEDVYQVFPSRTDADFLAWSTVPADEPSATAGFFEGFARAVAGHRQFIRPNHVLWGFTRRSIYGSGSSTQEIDPFATDRKQYLVVYPFAKTVDWYLKSRDSRQGMMNEHIRIGRQYPEIKQLLLYSFGLQEQEFVVVYETDNLVQFSDLVAELRGSEARRYTLMDTPVFTAVHHSPEDAFAIWS